VHIHPRQLSGADRHVEEVALGGGAAAHQHDRVAQAGGGHLPRQQGAEAPAGDGGRIVEGQQALQARGIEVAVAA
jgi:hypothetical protein